MDILQIVSSFFVGVIATIVGAYLLSLSAWRPFTEFRKTGVLKVFKNQDNATKYILKDIKKSSFLHLLAMKGESFSNPDKSLSKELYNGKIEHKYLISSLDNSYLSKREQELDFNMSVSITQSIKNFEKAKEINRNINVKQHKEVVRFRIILLKHCLYLSFQEVNIPGRKSPVLKIDNVSSMYKSFSSLFDDLWEKYS